MKNIAITTSSLSTILFFISLNSSCFANEDKRVFVDMPDMMQKHQLTNMRDHLMAINEILQNMGEDNLDKAADIAETRLGMSSLSSHGANHMAKMMPKEMRAIGTSMHKAASRFSLKAQEGDALVAYKSLQEVTAACVACHAGFRTR
ncbi:MAG: hypothetical protein V3U71_10120 [Cocleimonas sp.]